MSEPKRLIPRWETSPPPGPQSSGSYAFVAKTTSELIAEECDKLKELLLSKNAKYGDSALNPKGVFAKGSAEELIRTRIDDKLARIANGVQDDEDTITDLCGYLILLKVARHK